MSTFDYRGQAVSSRKMKMKKTFDRVLIVGGIAAIMIAVGGAGYIGFRGGEIWQASKGAKLLVDIHTLEYQVVGLVQPLDASTMTNDAEKELPPQKEKKASAGKNKAEMPPFPQSKPPVPVATSGGK